jgi:hypothetical protein
LLDNSFSRRCGFFAINEGQKKARLNRAFLDVEAAF